MHWKLVAQKGNLRSESSSSSEKLIKKRAKTLKGAGWKVRVTKVKKR